MACVVAACSFIYSCDKENNTLAIQPTITAAAGNIEDAVSAFKATLGPLNTQPGATTSHREINWDGVPDSMLNKPLPNDFFNQTGSDALAANQRGLTYSTGTFMASNNSFATVNSDASANFSAFSGNNTFANIAAAKWDVKFQQAGTQNSASVQSFGAVFSDVDEDSSTSMEFFEEDKSLGKFYVPPHTATSSFSFLGVSFPNDVHITKVTVTHDGFLSEGTKDITDGGTRDLIVLDDFIYSEPLTR